MMAYKTETVLFLELLRSYPGPTVDDLLRIARVFDQLEERAFLAATQQLNARIFPNFQSIGLGTASPGVNPVLPTKLVLCSLFYLGAAC